MDEADEGEAIITKALQQATGSRPEHEEHRNHGRFGQARMRTNPIATRTLSRFEAAAKDSRRKEKPGRSASGSAWLHTRAMARRYETPHGWQDRSPARPKIDRKRHRRNRPEQRNPIRIMGNVDIGQKPQKWPASGKETRPKAGRLESQKSRQRPDSESGKAITRKWPRPRDRTEHDAERRTGENLQQIQENTKKRRPRRRRRRPRNRPINQPIAQNTHHNKRGGCEI